MDIQALSPEIIQDTGDGSIPADLIASTFSSTCIDLISAPLGSRILATSDEWFAPASNLLTPTPPIRRAGVYVLTGAWYDGWETRRHNAAPFDWVVVKLGVASGLVRGVEIDTAYFDGNHAESIAVQGCFEAGEGADEKVITDGFHGWTEVLGKRECGPSKRHGWNVTISIRPVTHVRLLMFPDGGIARFRLYGQALPVFPAHADVEVELSAAVMGGVAVACSDEHFGTRTNLLLPGRGEDMSDGWETKRSRETHHEDWVEVRLGARGAINRIVVDTAHFRGNFPQAVKVEAADSGAAGKEHLRYVQVLGLKALGPDREHEFGADVLKNITDKAYTHVKMTIVPDGGVKRFRVFGTVVKKT